MGVACLNFRGENFRRWLKNREKFVKVFSLESFPLYGIIMCKLCICTRMYTLHACDVCGACMYTRLNILIEA